MDEDIFIPGMTEREIFIRRRVKRLAEFYRHLTMYVVVMAIFWILALIFTKTTPTVWWRWWPIWPTIGWGLGVLAHGLSVLPGFGFFSMDWEEKKVQALMKQERDERM
jgi:hypothetical protein